jgi:PhzF family phenazine biosynthesis protein
MTIVSRYAAFTTDQSGGNPAGVVLDAAGLADSDMQRIAAEVGYAETAFIVEPAIGGRSRHHRVRYFSPVSEVPFCGHATIATAVALAARDGLGALDFETNVGPIGIDVTDEGAAFTSVEPVVRLLDDAVLDSLLGLIGSTRDDLHPDLPPRVSFAGNWHPILVFAERQRFDAFSFDPDAMRALMDEQGWPGTVTTLRVVGDAEFEARNLFPVGTITEDPATGSAAASVGGYLRSLGREPGRIVIHQGAHVGRPSLLTVDIPATGGIVVSGTAVEID